MDAVIIKRNEQTSVHRDYAGRVSGHGIIPAATGSLTLYGMGEKPLDVKLARPLTVT